MKYVKALSIKQMRPDCCIFADHLEYSDSIITQRIAINFLNPSLMLKQFTQTVFITAIFILSLGNVLGQSNWSKTIKVEELISKGNEQRVTKPEKFRLVETNKDLFEQIIADLPQSHFLENFKSKREISVPMADGTNQRFLIAESSIMDPKLQKQFPNIRSYRGYGIDDPMASLRMSYSSDGIHMQIRSPQFGTMYIDPYFFKDDNYLMAYYKKDLIQGAESKHFECLVEDDGHIEDLSKSFQGDCNKREYMIAVAATGEYTGFHGGTVADGMAAINTTMTRVTGIYEEDLAISFTLVSNNSSVVYTNSATDPYSNNSANQMLNQNQSNLNSVIGINNYDVGHVFSTGGGGLAQLNVPCTSNRAKGVTGLASPVGDPFDIDYVCHELGHQFGARHTFNSSSGSCNGNQSNAAAKEPGSGSTIMGYAGICSSHNIQSNSDAYFHAYSIFEMQNFATGTGNSCPTVTTTSNTAPTVNAGADYSIPKSTPFVLTATGSDPNGDAISYCWEQYDSGSSATNGNTPQSTNTSGPMFRSFFPTTDTKRYFPNMTDILANNNPTFEVLASVARTMNFRVTARDYNPVGGCTEEDDMVVTVTSAGPFEVSSQNTSLQWIPGTTETVTWNVANTDVAPVSCALVDILLSTDGGLNFTTVLASNVANNGSASITVPSVTASDCRIMVLCASNIFFDINDTPIGIGMPPIMMYCEPTYNNLSCTSDDFIDGVSFGSINNTSNGCALNGNYSDYTSMSANVTQNTSLNMTVTVCPSYSQYVVALFDFNQDGDFFDAGEYSDLGFISSGASNTVAVNIPANATVGTTRMRVMCNYDNLPIAQADVCMTFAYGEYEDYNLVIASPCPNTRNVTTNYGQGDVVDLEASQIINANNLIGSGADIIYDAGTEVNLNNGFEVQTGAIFEAFNDGCGGLLKPESDDKK